MEDYICDALTTLWPPALACYGCAATVGIATAAIELLSRYGKGNKTKWVLIGPAQAVYYLINGLTAAAGLFASEALDKTQLLSLYESKPNVALLQAAGIGLAAMFALRSSLVSVEGRDDRSKVELGPAQIINILNRYLHRQIDKHRGDAAFKEIRDIMDGVNPDTIYPDILLCLAISEAIPPSDGERIKRNIELIMTNKDQFNPHARAISIGLELQREVGTDAVRNVVDILKAKSPSSAATQAPPESNEAQSTTGPDDAPTPSSTKQATGVQSLDDQLDAALVKLTPPDSERRQ